MKTKNLYISMVLALIVLSLGACTDELDRLPKDRVLASEFNNNPVQIEASVKGVYASFNIQMGWRYTFTMQELPTDVGIIPTRNGGWNSNQERVTHEHQWDERAEFPKRVYQNNLSSIANANFVLENIADKETFSSEVAELKFLRAFAYFQLIDQFGTPPIVTTSIQNPANIVGNEPVNEQRKKVFDFIEQDLLEVVGDLPSKNEVPENYYPRATKETAQTLLAKLYLNAEVWSGSARWDDCILQCNEVIKSGAYQLEEKITNSFLPENQNSKEIILSFVKINDAGGATGVDNGFFGSMLMFHQTLALKFGLKSAGFPGGFSVMKDHWDTYDPDDFRRSLILQGPQFLADGVTPLYNGATATANGKPEDGQFTITDIQDIGDAKNGVGEGFNSVKYAPDPEKKDRLGRNDVVLLRYADVLLSKAEAIVRGGNDPMGESAATLVNQVRARNFTTPKPITAPTLQNILDERAWEFSMEGHRRTDLIRFNQFHTLNYKFRVNFDKFREVYAIPQEDIDANSKLGQNPGY